MTLTGKTAIITGGGTGIGEAVSLKLATRGVNVIVNYSRSRTEAEDTATRCAALGVKSAAIRADVTEDDECRRLAADAQELAGRIDILVNNAGTSKFARHSDLEALSGEDYLAIYKTNVVGAYQMIRSGKRNADVQRELKRRRKLLTPALPPAATEKLLEPSRV